jgi:hypothetical protein
LLGLNVDWVVLGGVLVRLVQVVIMPTVFLQLCQDPVMLILVVMVQLSLPHPLAAVVVGLEMVVLVKLRLV